MDLESAGHSTNKLQVRMLVGGKFGPHVFDIAALVGKQETINRIEKAVVEFTK